MLPPGAYDEPTPHLTYEPIPPERIETVAKTLTRFFEPGEHVEIRCIKPFANGNLVASGGFTDPEEAAIWALAAEIDAGFNVYFGLNPRIGKRPSRELGWGRAYSRKHVPCLRWIFVDFDPVRGGDSSTNEEKQQARQLLAKLLRLLCRKYGWPTPIICDSGNGYHLLFRTHLAPDRRSLITDALRALADHFSTPQVTIDAGVDDAAQITRCYGTLNRKGDNTTERPWRYSRAFAGGGDGVVTQKQLEVLPIIYPPFRLITSKPERMEQSKQYTGQRYDVPTLLDDCDLAYHCKVFETDEGAADIYELAECPWSDEHSTGPGGACVIQFPNGAVSFKCHHDSCAERKWKDFKKRFDITMQKGESIAAGTPTEQMQLGAAQTAARMNQSRRDDCPAITADEIIGKFRRAARVHPISRQGDWSPYYVLANLAILGYGLNEQEALQIIETDYNSRCGKPKTREEIEDILQLCAKAAKANPDRVGQALQSDDDDETKRTETDRLVAFVRAQAKLWHSPLRDGFATIAIDNRRETYAIMSDGFEDWVVAAWLKGSGSVPKKTARDDARDILQCLARAKGPRCEAPVRVAATDNGQTIWLDLCDPKWRAVKITAKGWSIETQVPVRFVRYPTSEALPEPVAGGSIDELKNFASVIPSDWPLVVAWLVGCFLPQGTYPVLQMAGQQGSGKSTTQDALRRLVDPRVVKPPAGLPKDQEQLMLAARSTYIAAYNNVSRINDAQSDWLCCLVEGTAINKRTLYTTAGETILAVKRPVVLNGIGSAAVRGDLLDRSLLVGIQPPSARKSEQELWTSFEEARPRMLGALLSAVSTALARVADITIPEPRPRLLDFVRFATAAEPGLGLESGTVLRGMLENKQEASQRAIEAVPWVPALCLLLERQKTWKGTSSELLQDLQQEECRPPRNRRGNAADWIGWPKGAQPLANALSRLAPDLEILGIQIETGKTHGQRWLRLTFDEHV